MKVNKLVDNTKNLGKAEQYLTLSADFKKFLRNKYRRTEIVNIDTDEITKKFGLKGIVFGNYVTQEERYFFLFKTMNQMEALAKIKGSNKLAKGDLILAFGVEGIGKANAHYNPKKQLINLNRGRKQDYIGEFKGENSFVHEYAHYLDFSVGRVDPLLPENFASALSPRLAPNVKMSAKSKLFASVVDKIESYEPYIKRLESEYHLKRIEIFARYFEVAVSSYVLENDIAEKYTRFFERFYQEAYYLQPKELKALSIERSFISLLKSL